MENPAEAVRVRNLSVSFGLKRVIDGLSFSLGMREKCLIAGSNGAGKTTFLRALLGLCRPDSGEISVLGEEPGSAGWRRLKGRVGFVNQESVKTDLPISAREVVGIGLVARKIDTRTVRSIREAMDRTGCAHLEHMPYAKLSGGEKQRVSIARCLAQRPELLLLDEPTASLDPDAREAVLTLLERLELPILLVTHDEELLSRPSWRRELLRDGRFYG
jgi:ABC-type Mn2+/Zn2+ transport system ATPase subunit